MRQLASKAQPFSNQKELLLSIIGLPFLVNTINFVESYVTLFYKKTPPKKLGGGGRGWPDKAATIVSRL